MVVANWASLEDRRDNWRKELLDASRFAPEAPSLLAAEAFQAEICGPAPSWVLGGRGTQASYPLLRDAQQVAASGDTVLWYVPPRTRGTISAMGCPEMPSANSIDKS